MNIIYSILFTNFNMLLTVIMSFLFRLDLIMFNVLYLINVTSFTILISFYDEYSSTYIMFNSYCYYFVHLFLYE